MFKGFKPHIISVLVLLFFSVGWRTPVSDIGVIEQPANMSLLDGRMFVSDPSVGIHVYDVTDPSAPTLNLTIPARGNTGTAARDDIVYANTSHSLLVIRVGDAGYDVLKVIEQESADEFGTPWVDVPVRPRRSNGFGCACESRDDAVSVEYAPGGGSIGGSYATFSVIDDYLYFIENGRIVTMSIEDPADPERLSSTYVGWRIETMFPTRSHLFIGGERGMYVLDRTDPTRPRMIGQIQHFRACDPVVVSGPIAYVTLRGGSGCGQTNDVLLSVDILDPARPRLIGETSIETPYGLAVNGPLLYVSTGIHGFELLDVSDPEKPNVVKSFTGWVSVDFIWADDLLYAMGFDDLRIFDVTEPSEPVLLSEID